MSISMYTFLTLVSWSGKQPDNVIRVSECKKDTARIRLNNRK